MCDQILAAAPGDSDALLSKVAALIELGQANDALQVIESNPELGDACTFEKAYCLYNLYRESEALPLLMPGIIQPCLGLHAEVVLLY